MAKPEAQRKPQVLVVQGNTFLRVYLPIALVTLFALVVPQFISSFWVFIAGEVLIFAVYAISFNLLLGYGGMLSFGHAAYFGVGAYAAALLVTKAGVPMPLAFVAAPFFAAAAAGVFGFFCVRLAGVYFAMLTFALQMLAYTVVFKSYNFTGGDDGISGIWPVALIGSPINYYYFTVGVSVLAISLMYLLVNSPFGYAVRSIRSNPLRSQYVGINVRLYKWLMFVFSGFFAGIAGALLAFAKHSVFPDWLYWTASAVPIIMAVLGGIQVFLGPVVGAAVYRLLEVTITKYTEYWPMVVGVILVLLIVLMPQGILGTVGRWPRGWRVRIGRR